MKATTVFKAMRYSINCFVRRLTEFSDTRKMFAIIHKSTLQKPMKRKLYSLALHGRDYEELISEILESDISVIKKRTSSINISEPILICVIKNDLLRLELLLDYYRSIGVKAFAFLDDHSTDGTREYLLRQSDVTLYAASRPYTSTRRRAWINLIVNQEGIDRWYLIVDSDELFDYRDRESRSVCELTDHLERNKRKRVKAVMVDMFSPQNLYDDEIKTSNDIVRIMNRFDNHFCLRKSGMTDTYRVTADGGRSAVFNDQSAKSIPAFCLSKYPLMYFDRKDIMITSHEIFPLKRNKPDRPNTVLRHYKFIPGDEEKYEARVREKNFYGNSKEYKLYKQNRKKEQEYQECIRDFDVYRSYDSFDSIQILDDVWE